MSFERNSRRSTYQDAAGIPIFKSWNSTPVVFALLTAGVSVFTFLVR